MLKLTIPESKAKIQKQIAAMELALSQDTSEKDKEIHAQVIEALQKAIEALEVVENTPSKAGRPKTIDYEKVLELRNQGITQEKIAWELNISLATVRRILKKNKNKH